jgi:hypothetical protein
VGRAGQAFRGVGVLSRACVVRLALRLLWWRRLDDLLDAVSFAAFKTDTDAVPYLSQSKCRPGKTKKTKKKGGR